MIKKKKKKSKIGGGKEKLKENSKDKAIDKGTTYSWSWSPQPAAVFSLEGGRSGYLFSVEMK